MTPHPTTCSMNDSISRVAELMWDFDVTALPVTDRAGMVVGIVTRDDIRVARESSLSHRLVSNVMTAVAVTCTATDSTTWVEELMRQRHLARLPVSEDGMLVGVLLLEDISHAPLSSAPPLAPA